MQKKPANNKSLNPSERQREEPKKGAGGTRIHVASRSLSTDPSGLRLHLEDYLRTCPHLTSSEAVYWYLHAPFMIHRAAGYVRITLA